MTRLQGSRDSVLTISLVSTESHEDTRGRERGMREFKSVSLARFFVAAHGAVSNLLNPGRHLVRTEY